MVEFEKIWIEQCEAARGIREDFGSGKALGYLIGEKLLRFIQASDSHPEFARELPAFVAEIKRIFEPGEVAKYLATVRRVGPFGHIVDDRTYDEIRQMDAADNVIEGAASLLLLERAKELLLA